MSGRSERGGRVVTGVALAALAACGIDLVGTSAPPSAPDVDASLPPPSEGDAASDADLDADADLDGGADADADAAPPPRCDAGTIVDPLVTLDGGTWIVTHDGSNGDHPKIELGPDDAAAASLLTPNDPSSIGGIWLASPRMIRALDLSFHAFVGCPDAGACQDGLAVVWLAATDAGAAADLQWYASSPTFGIPANAHGAGVAFDLHADPGPQDTPAPNVSLLAIDGGAPASYDWTTLSTAPLALAGAHDVAIRVRKGVITVAIDGAQVLGGATATDFDAWFGLTASTGAAPATFYVRDVKATFYECDDP